ncbi:hypothetical protein H9P43_006183 [Blastocladiella emersonii ATCC 22665]|nr:hypothetical protein H9P43_006183 [Blastocladiella emersonii ATCC 22665]
MSSSSTDPHTPPPPAGPSPSLPERTRRLSGATAAAVRLLPTTQSYDSLVSATSNGASAASSTAPASPTASDTPPNALAAPAPGTRIRSISGPQAPTATNVVPTHLHHLGRRLHGAGSPGPTAGGDQVAGLEVHSHHHHAHAARHGRSLSSTPALSPPATTHRAVSADAAVASTMHRSPSVSPALGHHHFPSASPLPDLRALSGSRGTLNKSKSKSRLDNVLLRLNTTRDAISKTVQSVLASRHGSVLGRNFILKADQFPQAASAHLDVHLQGSPNFRMLDLNVYGVAQPTAVGLSTILTLLNCHPDSDPDLCGPTVWLCTREEPLLYINGQPYVLRHADQPMSNLTNLAGISGTRLEQLEARLRDDVLLEAAAYNGLFLVHDELSSSSSSSPTAGGAVVPSWIAATSVQTPREVVDGFIAAGYRLSATRVPVSTAQAPDDAYLDEYIRVLRAHPPGDPILISCGMGGGRTTMGTVVALLIRRMQLMNLGHPDPFPLAQLPGASGSAAQPAAAAEAQPAANGRSSLAVRELMELTDHETQNRALLRVMHILERGLTTPMAPHSAIEWALARGSLVDHLKAAVLGNYQVVLDLARVLDDGAAEKRLLDHLIDRCDVIINLREEILLHRVRGSVDSAMPAHAAAPFATAGGKPPTSAFGGPLGLSSANLAGAGAGPDAARSQLNSPIDRALYGLERYFYLLALAAYVADADAGAPAGFRATFSEWLATRPEISRMADTIRRGRQGHRLPLALFRPVDDLSVFGSSSSSGMMRGSGGQQNRFMPPVSSLVEVERYVLRNRTGMVLSPNTLLKVDFWLSQHRLEGGNGDASSPQQHPDQLRLPGASRFRRIGESAIYGVAQPTIAGMHAVHRTIADSHFGRTATTSATHVVWLNLREEPLIYLRGVPHVLRDQYTALRNVRSYRGITGERLELMEARLREDIYAELETYDARVLVHTEARPDAGEDENGGGNTAGVYPMWVECELHQVQTLREIADTLEASAAGTPPVHLYRVPVTAETPPDEADFDTLVAILAQYPVAGTAVVVNDQVGLGRTTMGTAMVWLVRNWLAGNTSLTTPCLRRGAVSAARSAAMVPSVHALLRVIRNGLEVKRVVDDAVDVCGAFTNIREAIVEPPPSAMTASSPPSPSPSPSPMGHAAATAAAAAEAAAKSDLTKRRLLYLQRYFMLLVFQAYLDDVPASTATLAGLEPFSAWLRRHPEILAMVHDLEDVASSAEDADHADRAAALLVPVEAQTPGDGIALTSEVVEVVTARRGAVLARQTILKHDAFPGCQKLTLPERIDGAPNFRHVPLAKIRAAVLGVMQWTASDPVLAAPAEDGGSAELLAAADAAHGAGVCGVAMPTASGVLKVLERLGGGGGSASRPSTAPFSDATAAAAAATVVWTCLREEPVLYINRKPYVLRTFQDPIQNLVTTGIARERVELMEDRMKADVLAELDRYGGRVLLHEEEAAKPGAGLAIVPVWESCHPNDVLTPRDVFEAAAADALAASGSLARLDYLRVPITDEQAPIPHVFDVLVARIMDAAVSRATSGARHHLVYNCQMGRGRTTTGMIIASLVHTIMVPSATSAALVEVLRGGLDGATGSLANLLLYNPGLQDELDDDDNDDLAGSRAELDPSRRYLRGEYRLVMQLVAVLSHGKLAKAIADACIDACNHMQNLREAILDYKRRVEALAVAAGLPAAAATGAEVPIPASLAETSKAVAKYRVARDVGINYLIRYFYLVAFAGYLLEMAEADDARRRRDAAVRDGIATAMSLPDVSVSDDGELEVLAAVPARVAPKEAAVSALDGDLRGVVDGAGVAADVDGGVSPLTTSFTQWLAERREITSIIERRNQDFA